MLICDGSSLLGLTAGCLALLLQHRQALPRSFMRLLGFCVVALLGRNQRMRRLEPPVHMHKVYLQDIITVKSRAKNLSPSGCETYCPSSQPGPWQDRPWQDRYGQGSTRLLTKEAHFQRGFRGGNALRVGLQAAVVLVSLGAQQACFLRQ